LHFFLFAMSEVLVTPEESDQDPGQVFELLEKIGVG
jgi:hypothetical protein